MYNQWWVPVGTVHYIVACLGEGGRQTERDRGRYESARIAKDAKQHIFEQVGQRLS